MSNNYVVIDRDNMEFIAATDTLNKASLIAWNDCPDVTTVVLPLESKRHFSTFGVLELLMLYKRKTGLTGDIYNFGGMITECYNLALQLPIDSRTEAELEAVSNKLPVSTDLPKIPKPPIIQRFNPAETGANPFVTASEPSAPKIPSKPSPKGATGRVWEIAEAIYLETGGAIDKVLRTKIVAACEAAGIHPATAATQFSKWKASK